LWGWISDVWDEIFGGLIEFDVLDESLMAGTGMTLDENNGWA
jgi:hypothetical protein